MGLLLQSFLQPFAALASFPIIPSLAEIASMPIGGYGQSSVLLDQPVGQPGRSCAGLQICTNLSRVNPTSLQHIPDLVSLTEGLTYGPHHTKRKTLSYEFTTCIPHVDPCGPQTS